MDEYGNLYFLLHNFAVEMFIFKKKKKKKTIV